MGGLIPQQCAISPHWRGFEVMFTQTRSAPEVIRYEDDNRYILLRRSQMNDVAQLCAGVQDSLTELKRYMPWAHFKAQNTLEAQTKRCEDLIQAWDSGRDFTFNLFVRQPDGELRFSGCLGLHPRCLGNHGWKLAIGCARIMPEKGCAPSPLKWSSSPALR